MSSAASNDSSFQASESKKSLVGGLNQLSEQIYPENRPDEIAIPSVVPRAAS